jgi:hypothetical protein
MEITDVIDGNGVTITFRFKYNMKTKTFSLIDDASVDYTINTLRINEDPTVVEGFLKLNATMLATRNGDSKGIEFSFTLKKPGFKIDFEGIEIGAPDTLFEYKVNAIFMHNYNKEFGHHLTYNAQVRYGKTPFLSYVYSQPKIEIVPTTHLNK